MDHTLSFPPFLVPRRAAVADQAVRLAAGETLARILPAGCRVAVLSGRVWLTQRGDYSVDAGQCHVVTRSGKVVIESLTASATLRLLRDPPRAHAGFP